MRFCGPPEDRPGNNSRRKTFSEIAQFLDNPGFYIRLEYGGEFISSWRVLLLGRFFGGEE
jgi:hypothetical protein